MATWTCPSAGTPAANASNILSTADMFFSWMSQPDARAACTTVSASDVQKVISTYSTTSTTSTQLSNLNTQVQQLQQTLKQKENDAAIAQARAAQIVRPEMSASYYDSWFPLGRPLKRAAVPVLIFFSSLLISASFFMLLGVLGIRSHFFVLVPDTEKTGTITKPFMMLLGITILLFCLTIYSFMR
jgi:hypothetical protein